MTNACLDCDNLFSFFFGGGPGKMPFLKYLPSFDKPGSLLPKASKNIANIFFVVTSLFTPLFTQQFQPPTDIILWYGGIAPE
jgi:hypothetical protein